MRVNEPKRPVEDMAKNADQFYRWMYQVTEQLNMAFAQLERVGVLDLQVAANGTAEEQLLDQTIASLRQRLTAAEARISALEAAQST